MAAGHGTAEACPGRQREAELPEQEAQRNPMEGRKKELKEYKGKNKKGKKINKPCCLEN